MAPKSTGQDAIQGLFDQIDLKRAGQKPTLITGLPHLTALTYFITANPQLQPRTIFLLLKNEDLAKAQRLLIYWHTSFKLFKPIWLLTEINPIRAIRLQEGRPQISLLSFSECNAKLPSPNHGQHYELVLKTKEQWTPAELSQRLISFGYDFTGQAGQPGFFARRGGVLDIYPINAEKPVRIEFEGNVISSLASFNPVNKRAGEKFSSCHVIAKKFGQTNSRASFFSYLERASNPLIVYGDTEDIKELDEEWASHERKISAYQTLIIRDFDAEGADLHFEHAPLYHRNFTKLAAELSGYHQRRWQISIATTQVRELKQLLQSKKAGDIPILYGSSSHDLEGFKNEQGKLLLLTDKEIYGVENGSSPTPNRSVEQAFIMGLKPGDFVVHLDHGIGRFTKMNQNVVEGITKEYFVIEYSDGDKLYVPVETADKISKYIGIANPKLHRLSSGQWYQLTRKVKQEAKILAHELLKIYAKRELCRTKPFSGDTPEDRELAATFPYRETPDQAKAILDVKHDLEQETPMDRLICGDVGFGKTEVAVRAALKAVMNKTQVALLSPTTILTQQHYDTFRERLKKFSTHLAILSRFESNKEQHKTVQRLKSGLADIVIGTHRLLSADVSFRNLGLIIIDEEQRFGVKAKEKLKALRTQAHILTLTATPIPRTLNIALSGVRDVSIIETPPEGRLPIKTYIEPYTEETIRQAIATELDRGGQVYYLHNKVETIGFAVQSIKKLAPKANIGIAHGRLPEKDLARAMADFDTGTTDILVCSTIIENGLDLPNVNTLIVDNATNFGLAQLYQLRGRIGRGDKQAHAFFLYHRKQLKGNAKKRLQALLEAKKLGSGFQLALRDLEIRGAGNILGKEQHGKVSAIGLSLYTRLLAQAIEELKYGKIQEPIRDVIIDLPLEAYIPQEFLPEEERLILYQKMAGVVNLDELRDLKEKMFRSRSREEQRNFPIQLTNLFEVLEIRLLTQKTDIANIDTSLITDQDGTKKRRILLKFLFPLKPEQLARLLQKDQGWQFTDDTVKNDLDRLGKDWLGEIKKAIRIFQK